MRSRDVKVGLFVVVGLALTAWLVMMIGEDQKLFDSTVTYKAKFQDVQGLKAGAPVHMGGINVGTVSGVGYSEDVSDRMLYVRFTITEKEARHVREGSTVTIQAKGLLGDQMIVVEAGHGEKQLPPGSFLPVGKDQGLAAMVGNVKKISSRAEKVMGNLESFSTTIAEDGFRDDVASTLSSLESILKKVDEGNGPMGKLLDDEEEARKLSSALTNLEKSTERLERLLGGVEQAVHRVNHGPGLAHEVIYGDSGTRTMVKFGDAAEEVALSLKGIREGDGPAKSLLYGDEKSEGVMTDLKAMSGDLRDIVAGVRDGKGTIGALLTDPSVYEDLKLLLGNVQRNRTLRALVRYSIKQDEVPPADVEDPASGTSATAK